MVKNQKRVVVVLGFSLLIFVLGYSVIKYRYFNASAVEGTWLSGPRSSGHVFISIKNNFISSDILGMVDCYQVENNERIEFYRKMSNELILWMKYESKGTYKAQIQNIMGRREQMLVTKVSGETLKELYSIEPNYMYGEWIEEGGTMQLEISPEFMTLNGERHNYSSKCDGKRCSIYLDGSYVGFVTKLHGSRLGVHFLSLRGIFRNN